MIILIFLIIIIFIVISLYFIKTYKNDNLVYIKSNIDNSYYWVRDKYNKVNAANTLASIKQNIQKLVFYLKENQEKFPENMEYIKALIMRTKVINIMETPEDEKFTSYTINKGEKIVFCLRCKVFDNIHDINTLMYVVIHELAHVGCPEFGHTPLFKQIFKFLLIQSNNINIYKPIDYRINPQTYCGMTITEYLLD